MKKLVVLVVLGFVVSCSSPKQRQVTPKKKIPVYKSCGDCKNYSVPSRNKSEHMMKMNQVHLEMEKMKLETKYAKLRKK